MPEDLAPAIVGLVAAVVILLIAWSGGKLLVVFLRRLARHTKSDYDGGLVEALGPRVGWLIAAVGFALGSAWLTFLGETGRWLFDQASFFLFVGAVAEGSRRWFEYALDHYVTTRGDSIDSNVANELVPLSKRLGVFIIYGITALGVAGHFGINVLAISTALGLSGFAIALALKDTITNIFSGIVIMISRPFAIGDRIDLPVLDVWGDVSDIGIRSTTAITRDNRMVIVPNSAVVDNPVVNYSRPDPSYRLQTDIGLDTSLDMRRAQESIRAEVRKVDGVLSDRPVDVWFTEFGDYSNTVRVRWWVASYAEKRRSMDAVNNAIVDVSLREGISMPDPHMTFDGRLALKPDGSLDAAGSTDSAGTAKDSTLRSDITLEPDADGSGGAP